MLPSFSATSSKSINRSSLGGFGGEMVGCIRGLLSRAFCFLEFGDFLFFFDSLAISFSGLFPIEADELVRQLAFMLVNEFSEITPVPYRDLFDIHVGNNEGTERIDPFR